MLKIKFADNTEYEIHSDTTVFPSGSSTIRSRMEIHMVEETMSLNEFEELMTNNEKTKTMRIIDVSEDGTITSDIAYSAYTIVASVGKKRCDVTDHVTGATYSENHLVSVIEQLTYIEQQLVALGINV